MADDLNDKGNPDRSLISMSENHEAAYWTKRFNVTKEQLNRAIDGAGSHSVEMVEKYLQQNK